MDKAAAKTLVAVTDRRIITAKANAFLEQGEGTLSYSKRAAPICWLAVRWPDSRQPSRPLWAWHTRGWKPMRRQLQGYCGC